MDTTGFSKVPFSLFVLKVASRCNLNCKYCYVYNHGDLSYLDQPRAMSGGVVTALLEKIRRHCLRHAIAHIGLVFHGGEPMLAGQEFFRGFVDEANRRLCPEVTPHFMMQTNGTLLDAKWLDLLCELDIGFSISLDGPSEVHDANRVDESGGGSYEAVRRAIELALADPRCARLFGTVSTVINLACDPLRLYHHFKELGLRGVDFMLPEGSYDRPPLGLSVTGEDTPYADWLIRIFDPWFKEGNPAFTIRLFENIIALIFGCRASADSRGGRENDVLVIETDGGMEPVDVLKSCGHGFTKIGYNVLRNEVDDVYRSSLMRTYQEGTAALCETCQECTLRDVCGGGYLPHRYSSSNSFANPSVYCRDLAKLITHIQACALDTLPEQIRLRYRLAPIPHDAVWRLARQRHAIIRARADLLR